MTHFAGVTELLMNVFGGEDESPAMTGLTIDHPDYPVTTATISSRRKQQEFTLPDPGRLQLIARQDGENAVLQGLHPQFDKSDGIRWSEEDGLLSIERIDVQKDSQTQMMRLVHIPDSGPAWFSETSDPRERAKVLVPQTIVLQRGVDLTGKLSANVPRPVKNGHIQGLVTAHGPENERLCWMVSAPVSADGAFRLDSLPPDKHLQIVASCDGWVSRFQTDDEAEREAGYQRRKHDGQNMPAGGMVMARWHRMTPDQPLEIPMERTGSFEILAVDTDNRPLAGVEFHCLPHQSFRYWGSTNLTGTGSTIDSVRAANGDGTRPTRPFVAPSDDLDVVTDANGIARFNGIPCSALITSDQAQPVMVSINTARFVMSGSRIDGAGGDISDYVRTANVCLGEVLRTTFRMTRVPEQIETKTSP
jgi:hypothetical protein